MNYSITNFHYTDLYCVFMYQGQHSLPGISVAIPFDSILHFRFNPRLI